MGKQVEWDGTQIGLVTQTLMMEGDYKIKPKSKEYLKIILSFNSDSLNQRFSNLRDGSGGHTTHWGSFPKWWEVVAYVCPHPLIPSPSLAHLAKLLEGGDGKTPWWCFIWLFWALGRKNQADFLLPTPFCISMPVKYDIQMASDKMLGWRLVFGLKCLSTSPSHRGSPII